jgi:hypothetical protein
VTLNDAPYCGIVNAVVTVNDAIAKAYDTRQFVDAFGCMDISSRQTAERFSDDFEFALYCPPKLPIGFVISKGSIRTPITNTPSGF